MKLIADDLGDTPAEIVSNSDLCINGTTVGLNALIQHKGGKTGLICTAGTRGFNRNQAGSQRGRLSLRPRISGGGDVGAALSAQGVANGSFQTDQ